MMRRRSFFSRLNALRHPGDFREKKDSGWTFDVMHNGPIISRVGA
jgi:hypothetical protein